jgi:integrase
MYSVALTQFIKYVSMYNFKIKSMVDLDEVLCDYIHVLYLDNNGRGRGNAINTLYAIYKCIPGTMHQLTSSALSLKGWSKTTPHVSHPPIPYHVMISIAFYFLSKGKLSYAIGVILAFIGLLRVNELVGLRREDLIVVEGGFGLRLSHTKTGNDKTIIFNNEDNIFSGELLSLVYNYILSFEYGRLFQFNAMEFRCTFTGICKAYDLKFVPHSLRHGGATYLFMRNVPLVDIMNRGRWASSASLFRYLQVGRNDLLLNSINPIITKWGELISNNILLAFVTMSYHSSN